jgi:hypothetical protein
VGEKESGFGGFDFKPCYREMGVHKAPVNEIGVPSQESWQFQANQKRNNVLVLHSLTTKVSRKRLTPDTPLLQKIYLARVTFSSRTFTPPQQSHQPGGLLDSVMLGAQAAQLRRLRPSSEVFPLSGLHASVRF